MNQIKPLILERTLFKNRRNGQISVTLPKKYFKKEPLPRKIKFEITGWW